MPDAVNRCSRRCHAAAFRGSAGRAMSRLLENGLKSVNPRGYQGGQGWLWWALTRLQLPGQLRHLNKDGVEAAGVLDLLEPLRQPGDLPLPAGDLLLELLLGVPGPPGRLRQSDVYLSRQVRDEAIVEDLGRYRLEDGLVNDPR